MKARLKPWYLRMLQVFRDAFREAGPGVVENSLARTRRLQRRVAREANRTPFTPPQRRVRAYRDQGFQ